MNTEKFVPDAKPFAPAEPKKKGLADDVATDSSLCNNLESYHDIKNRAPSIIKTWQELMEGSGDDDDLPD